MNSFDREPQAVSPRVKDLQLKFIWTRSVEGDP